MTAVRPLRTEQERRGEISSALAILRAVALLFVILAPLVAVVAVISGVLLVRQRRVQPRPYLLLSVAVFLAALLTGRLPLYWLPVGHLVETVLAGGLWPRPAGDLARVVLEQISSHWLTWLLGALPFAAAAGLLIGAIWAAVRSRRRATWRDEPDTTRPVPAAEIDSALAKLSTWPAGLNPVTRRPVENPSIRAVRLPLGVMATGRPLVYGLTLGELGAHGYVDGPTGMGKTTTVQEICAGVVENPAAEFGRCPLVFITMKPDPQVTRALAGMAQVAGRRFWHVTENGGAGGARYSPFSSANAYEIASAVLECLANGAGGGFSEPHHREAGDRYLKFAARAMVELHRLDPDRNPVDYATLSRYMTPGNITQQSDRFSPTLATEWAAYMKELDAERDLNRSIAGLRQRVANAAEGGARDVLRADDGALVLADAIEAGDVVVFDLDAAADATASRLIGNLVLQDAGSSLARLGGRNWQHWRDNLGDLVLDATGDPVQKRHAQIVIDEFSALGGSLVEGLFRRSRGHGAGVLLATQEAGSLDAVSETFKETVITNACVLVLHVQTLNAQMYADLVGTHEVWQESSQIFEEGSLIAQNVYKSGQGNLRQVREYVVHPDQLRSLGRGEVYVRVLSRPGEAPARVRVRRSVEARHRAAGADTEFSPVETGQQSVPAASSSSLVTSAVSGSASESTANPYLATLTQVPAATASTTPVPVERAQVRPKPLPRVEQRRDRELAQAKPEQSVPRRRTRSTPSKPSTSRESDKSSGSSATLSEQGRAGEPAGIPWDDDESDEWPVSI